MTDKWIKDTGLVLALIFLVSGFNGGKGFLFVSASLLLITIFVPKAFYPIAYLWLKFVEILNLVIPKIFFGIVFFVIIFPVGLIRKLIKGDILMVSEWREAKSAFVDRNHLFTNKDLETPY